MASPQTRSPSLLSGCVVALRRYPAITAFAGAATLMAATAIVNRQFAKPSKLHRIAGAGHKIQQSRTPDLMAAIDEAAAEILH